MGSIGFYLPSKGQDIHALLFMGLWSFAFLSSTLSHGW